MLKSNLQLGTLLITRLAGTFLEQKGVSVLELVDKHASGDWGDICEEDKGVNEDALHYGNRVMSVYNITNTESIWIITEADRRSTTILLPEEY